MKRGILDLQDLYIYHDSMGRFICAYHGCLDTGPGAARFNAVVASQ